MSQVLKNGELNPRLINEANLSLVRKHYAHYINSAVSKYVWLLEEERGTVRSQVDEIFLKCVRNWDVEKCRSCKFRSFFLTSLRNRMSNFLRERGRKKQMPRDKVVTIHNIASVDHNLHDTLYSPQEQEDSIDGEDNFQGRDRDPLEILSIKECVVYLKTRTANTMRAMVKVIEDCISKPALACSDDGEIFKVVKERLGISTNALYSNRNKLKQKALEFMQN